MHDMLPSRRNILLRHGLECVFFLRLSPPTLGLVLIKIQRESTYMEAVKRKTLLFNVQKSLVVLKKTEEKYFFVIKCKIIKLLNNYLHTSIVQGTFIAHILYWYKIIILKNLS